MGLIFTVFISVSYGQAPLKNTPVFFQVNYFGILGTHPGIKLNIGYVFKRFNYIETREGAHSDLRGNIGVGFYFQKASQAGVFLETEFGYRKTSRKDNIYELLVGLGYFKSIIPSPCYLVDDNGNIQKKSFIGGNHFMRSFSFGYGKSFKNFNAVNAVLIRPTLFSLRPYNTNATSNFAMQAGFETVLKQVKR